MTTTVENTAAQTEPAAEPLRFTTTHAQLATTFKTLTLVAGLSKPIAPILAGVHTAVDGEWATLSAFDYDTSVRVTTLVDDDGTGRGAGVLHHGEITKLLKAMAAGEKPSDAARMAVTVDDGTLASPDMTVPLASLELDDYPQLPIPSPASVVVDGREFFATLTRVLPSCGTDDTMPVLESVHMTLRGDTVEMLSTDRYRAAHAVLDAAGKDGPETVVNVPSDVLKRLVKLLPKYDGPVGIGVNEPKNPGMVTLHLGSITVTTRATAGDFPKLVEIFPKTAHGSYTVSRAALVKAVKKAYAVAQVQKNVAVGFTFGGDGSVVLVPQVDENRDKVKGVTVAADRAGRDPEEVLWVNGFFLGESLTAFAGDAVTLHFQNEYKPVLLTDGEDIAGDNYRHMIMPVRPNS